MPSEQIVPYKPSAFAPSITFGGDESFFTIRGKNLWLKSKATDSKYAVAYKGSKNINEPIPTKQLTGTIAWNVTDNKLTGTGTRFTDELQVGQFIVTDTVPSEMFVVTEVTDYLHAVVSRPFTNSNGGVTAFVLPVIYPLGSKRATQIRGNCVRFPRGHILGVGDGELKLNGQSLIAPFNLSKKPRYAIYDKATGLYHTVDYGIELDATVPLFSLADGGAGVKNMFAGDYGVRVVAKSTDTGGYSNPSANVTVTLTAGHKIRIVFNAAMNTATGQNAYDIYVTKFISADANAGSAVIGVQYLYETVTAEQLKIENSVADGTVAGLHHDFEFADGELEASGTILSFDNFPPLDAEFVDLINATPIFFGCEGNNTNYTTGEITSPGPKVIPAKGDNAEAVMLNKAVSTANGDLIVGVMNVRGRFWVLCENSLQTVILTGVESAPITCRSFWDVGFRNPFNLKFLKDYAFGYSTNGFLRSIGIGDESSVDFDFSIPVDDYTTDWNTSHVISAYDPKNKAMCFFFAGYDRSSGFWKTMVLPFIPSGAGFWNPPIILEKADQDFIVSGAATVGQALYFLAGGRNSDGDIVFDTYEFDAADNIEIECVLAWAYSDFGSEDYPPEVAGVASLIGNVTDAKVEIHGIGESGAYDLTALENGHNIALQTIDLGSTTGFGRIAEKRQSMQSFSKLSPRLSFTSLNGSGRIDELNLLITSNASRK